MSFRLQITGINSKSSQSNPGIDIEEPNPIRALIASHADLSASHYDLSANHSALKSTVTDLSASHYDLSANHRALKSTVSDLSASHYDLSANHRALKSTVSDLSASHYDLSRNHLTLKNTVSDLSASHYDLSRNHLTLKNTVTDLSASHYDLSANHRALKTLVTDLSASHYDLSANHRALKTLVTDLSASHYDLSANHRALKTLVTDLSASHYDLSANHRALKTLVTDLSTNNNIRFNNIDTSLSQVYTKTQSDSIFVSKSNIDLSNLSTNIIPSTDNTYKIGDISKNWRNAYIKDISATNIDIANNLNVLGPTQLKNTLNVADNVTLKGSTLYAPESFYIDPYAHGVNTGTVFINGNLTVLGLTTTINSTTIDISDKTILLASNASNPNEANGAGIEISGANVNFIYEYDNLTSAFRSSIGLSISGNVVPATGTIVNLGQSDNRWKIAYIDELNVNSFTYSINGANITSETITSTQIMNNTIVDDDISASASIAFSKINTTNAITNSDISTNAAIAFSKINTTNAIVNSDISNNAAIAFSKINTTNAITNSDISNNASIAFSKINTTNAIVNSDISTNASIAFSKINTTNAIVNSDISNNASIAFSKINTTNAIMDSDISTNAAIQGSKIASETITSTQIMNNTIVDGDISNNAAIAFSKINATNAIVDDDISANANILGSKLAINSITSDKINQSNNWTFSQLTSNTANIRDISTTNISVSGSIIPLDTSSSDLGSGTKRFNKIFTNDLSVNTINGQAYNAAPDLTSVSGNIIPSLNNTFRLGDTSRNWSNAYITDISASNISVSGNILPLRDISSDLGSSLRRWRNIYVNDLSVSTINGQAYSTTPAIDLTSVSGNIIPASNNTFRLGDTSRNWSNAYIRDISATNISISGNIIFSVSGGSMRIAADTSNNSISTTHRIYQNISGGINDTSWAAVNGYYALAKDAYPGLNPLSSGVKAVQTWTARASVNGQSNRWTSICWSPELRIFVAVAESFALNNRVMTSPDGITWTGRTSANDSYAWQSVCWSPELRIFVAVASSGDNKVMTSSDGITWAGQTSSNETNGWWGVCWSPQLRIFVAVASSGSNTVMTSSDGITWNGRTSSNETNGWWGVCWSPQLSLFVAVSRNGSNRVMTSPDGTTWTGRTSSNETNSWRDVCWSGELGLFVAVGYSGSNRVMTSSNGITWTGRLSPNEENEWWGVCWSPELRLFVAVANTGTHRVMISNNGTTWTGQLVPNTGNWRNVCWSPELGLFAATANFGGNFRVMTSSLKGRPPTSYNVFDSSFNSIDENGNWTFSNRIYQNISGGINDLSWAAVNGYYALAKQAYPSLNPYSSGAKAVQTWTVNTQGVPSNCYWRDVCWSPELRIFVAVAVPVPGPTAYVMYSSNGIQWTSVSVDNNHWFCVEWSPQLRIFVALAMGGATNNRLMTSNNGKDWTMRPLPVNNRWMDVCWSPELEIFVATAETPGTSNLVMTSKNGIDWSLQTPSQSNSWYGICWSPELKIFVAVAGSGTNRVMISNNGINWQAIGLSQGVPDIAWISICWSSQLGLFVAVAAGWGGGNNNYIMTSQNGTTWTTINNPNHYAGTGGICWCPQLELFVAISYSLGRAVTSPDGITWTAATQFLGGELVGGCWSPELGIFVIVGGTIISYSSLKGRPPTSYNVFDSSFNSIDENGNWTFSAIDISTNLNPSLPNSGSLGLSNKRWANAFVNDLSVNTINGFVYSTAPNLTSVTTNIIPSTVNSNLTLGNTTNTWSNAYIRDISATNISVSGNIIFSISGGSMRIAADASTNSITSTHRIYQNISGGINDLSWASVNGYYALAKDAYPGLNPLSSGEEAVKTWTARVSSNDTNRWYGICWSPELRIFVAVAYLDGSNKVMTSSDGINWTGSLSANETYRWNSVCWSPKLRLFVAVGDRDNALMTSQNGINWTPGSAPSSCSSICWSPELGLFVAVAELGEPIISQNGTTWHQATRANNNYWGSVCWAKELGIFVAVAWAGTTAGLDRVMTSPDGTNWTSRLSADNTASWGSVCWSGELNLFVSVGRYGNTTRAMTSPDGINWTSRTIPFANWNSVCWSPELRLFVAVAKDGPIATSPNGIAWTSRTYPIHNEWSSICWSPELGIFAAVASAFQTKRVMTSSLQGRPPTSYNVFNSRFNRIDENGNWTFSAIDISSNLNPSISLTGNLGTASKIWGNAVIRDLSVGSIDVGINVYPSLPNSGSLGLSNKRWANAFINDLSVSTINGQAYSATTAIDLTSVSGNIIPSLNNTFRLGDTSRNWSNAYIRDISVTNISVSGNIIFSVSGNSMRIAADTSTNSITSTHRIYQNISGDISWAAVNGHYGLAKDAYPRLNSVSSGAKAVSTWTRRTTDIATDFQSICWSPKLMRFVAVGDGRSIYSLNGINWPGLFTGGGDLYREVCWSHELEIFVAVCAIGSNNISRSSTGTGWSTVTANTTGLVGVCWSAELGIFVAVGDSGTRVRTSKDGITWSEPSISQPPPLSSWNTVCWSAELCLFVAVANASTSSGRVMISNNGSNWQEIIVELSSWQGVCWSKQLGLFVAVADGGNNRVMISNNGITWKSINVPSYSYTCVCWSAELGIFVAGADYNIVYSANGINWTLVTISNSVSYFRSISWSPELGIFTAAGNNLIMTSSFKGRLPTGYNVFDGNFNSIDETGNWTFAAIDINTNLNPTIPDSGNLGLSNKRWANAFVNDLSVTRINGQAYSAGGGLTANSVNSSHIIDGSILGTDISSATITGSNIASGTITSSNIADGTIVGTDISSATIQGSNIASGTITSSNIADGTILGTDISGATITGANIANETIEYTNLVPGLKSFISNTYTGIFEISCNTSFIADFYFEEDDEKIYLFQNEGILGGGQKSFKAYHSLPFHFATIPFFLETDQTIESYSLTFPNPTNGIINHSKAGAGRIQFNILRNSQHYLELNILIQVIQQNTGFYGTILFTFNTDAALDFVLNIAGYASNVSINTSTNTWTLPIGSRLATTSTLLPPIQIYPVHSYAITSAGFLNSNITFVNSPPYGFSIPTNLYNTTIEFNMTTVRD